MKTIYYSFRLTLLSLLLAGTLPAVYAQTTRSCQASFTTCKAPSAGAAGMEIRFTNTSTGNYTNSLWTFGDGDTSLLPNPVHIYVLAKPFYIACLTVFNASAACYNTVCDTVFANAPACSTASCIDSALIDPSKACPDVVAPVCGCNGVTYTNSCVAEYVYGVSTWTVGACQGPHTCSADFTYKILLTPGAALASVEFTSVSASTDPVVTYSWNFGDGGTSNLPDPSHLYHVPGTYIACLTIATAGGCTSTKCDTLVFPGINPCGTINISADWAYSQTAPLTISFHVITAAANTSFIYAWDFSDNSTSGIPNPTHRYSSAGTYNVCLIVRAGACADTICKEVAVTGSTAPCEASFTYNPLFIAAVGYQVQFVNTSTGNYQHLLWTFGDGDSSRLPDPIHNYSTFEPDYVVCLTISDSSGNCNSTTCDTVRLILHSACIDTSLINRQSACPTIYAPVCGCDGNTYINSCVAENYFGVSSWTPGKCYRIIRTPVPPPFVIPPVAFHRDYHVAAQPSQTDYENFAMEIYPNPAGDKANIIYVLPGESQLLVDVTDMMGNIVARLYFGTESEGQQQLSLETGTLANGIYLVRVIVNGDVHTQKLSVVH